MGQVTSIHPDQAIRAAPAAYPAPNADLVRIKYGAWLIVAAFLLLGPVFSLVIWQFSAAADVTGPMPNGRPVSPWASWNPRRPKTSCRCSELPC